MATLHQDRRIVFLGIVAAWLGSGIFIYFGQPLLASAGFADDFTPEEALAFALMLAALPLFAGIASAARLRHFESNIDGSTPVAGSSLDLTLRFNTNTLEQLVLFFIASLCAAIFVPSAATSFLPIMGLWFIIARAAFFIGYRINPLARAFGFAATFHPTIILGAYALIAAFSSF